ncbi:hypothetical protein [Antrihabitans stalactiti]|uniref:Uncharacterized protein n=1 Tax=Antrihabitans stalactiti TaxID=2584121 RepID=A0A848KPC2_9NOCA|nr:hypothetical protein [Antrihabitans stalactiti]NMN98140.1 hypothetical protein [Antrihabitans stalactiti]
MTTILTLLILGAFAAAIYHFAPHSSKHGLFHLDQFRPAAPLAGFLPGDYEQQRLYADIAAIHAHDDHDDFHQSTAA